MLPALRDNASLASFTADPVNRLDSLFDRFFGDDGGLLRQTSSWAPVAMWEDENHIHVEAELPGLANDDLEVTVHNGMLFIRGQRKPAEGRRYLYNSRTYGRFERVITLPQGVATDDVKAALINGVLEVDLPKSPEAKPKRITLSTG